MNELIKESIDRSMTYKEYRDLVADLLVEGKSTGSIQSEDYLNYSRLGNARMKRLDKTFELTEGVRTKINRSSKKFSWIVLTEGWCGDAAHALPIINKISDASDKRIDVKIVLRDDNEALMNQFLTNGSKSIPKLIAIDAETDEVVHTWGPRPSIATKMVQDYKEEKGSLDADFKKELQVWYHKNKGENILNDLLKLITF